MYALDDKDGRVWEFYLWCEAGRCCPRTSWRIEGGGATWKETKGFPIAGGHTDLYSLDP